MDFQHRFRGEEMLESQSWESKLTAGQLALSCNQAWTSALLFP